MPLLRPGVHEPTYLRWVRLSNWMTPAILAEASKNRGTVLQKRRDPGSALKARARPNHRVNDQRKWEQACELAARKLAQAKAEKNIELKKLAAEIGRLSAKQKKAEEKHDRAIAKLETRLETVRAKLDR